MDDNCSAVRAYNVYPVQRKMCVLLVLWTLWGNKRRCSTWFCVLLWFWPSGKTWYHVACECEHLRNVKPSILCSLSDIGKQLNTASLVHVQAYDGGRVAAGREQPCCCVLSCMWTLRASASSSWPGRPAATRIDAASGGAPAAPWLRMAMAA